MLCSIFSSFLYLGNGSGSTLPEKCQWGEKGRWAGLIYTFDDWIFAVCSRNGLSDLALNVYSQKFSHIFIDLVQKKGGWK